MLQHTVQQHKEDDVRASTDLTRPVALPLPYAPAVLPAYMVEARAVAPCSISAERHAVLGPWVGPAVLNCRPSHSWYTYQILRNIFGPVQVSKRYNAAKPLRTAAATRGPGSGAYGYEFLASTSTYSTNPSEPSRVRDLPDLHSSEVSQLISEGMILWPGSSQNLDDDGDDVESDSPSITEGALQGKERTKVK